MKRVKHSRTTQHIAVIIAYLLLLSRRHIMILMSPAAVSGQNLYLEIARTRSDGKRAYGKAGNPDPETEPEPETKTDPETEPELEK